MRTEAARLALRYLAHPLASFHPARMPPLTRSNYRRELVYVWFFSFALAVVEGGVIGVITKNAFEGVVPATALNYVVALLAAAPEFANLTSFLWVWVGHGRAKVPLINGLQMGIAAFVVLIAFVPRNLPGLIALAVCVVTARALISGIVTLRAAVWRANYPRAYRARVTGNLGRLQAIVLALAGLGIGIAMNPWPRAFRVIFPAAGLISLAGIAAYRKIRVRRHKRLIRSERAGHGAARPSINPVSVYRTLAADRNYAWFMLWMFVFGAGNLMLTAPLIITLRERFGLHYLGGIVITQSIPYLVLPFATPMWARLLDRVHVVRFRAIHAWSYVASQSLILGAAMTGRLWLVYIGSVFQGIALSGGSIAWNLGHLDFAPPHQASNYMGVHVTLNGVRGLLAPIVAVTLYEVLERRDPGGLGGAWVFAVSVAMCVIGGLGFVGMSRSMGAAGRRAPE